MKADRKGSAERLVSTDQPAPLSEAAAHYSAEGYPKGKRVLLADDDSTVLQSISDVLVAEGYVVIPAENGQRAIDLDRRLAVDLAVLDLTMPIKNGWEAFEQLSHNHPLLPIIIVTARPNQLFTAMSAGVGALLEKPVDIPTLLRTMQELLAEPAEQHLARQAGKMSDFTYKPARHRDAPEGQNDRGRRKAGSNSIRAPD